MLKIVRGFLQAGLEFFDELVAEIKQVLRPLLGPVRISEKKVRSVIEEIESIFQFGT